MAPFAQLTGGCRGVRNTFEIVDDATTGGCQRRCWETLEGTNDDPTALAGRCVAYSISVAPHEASMCSWWDALGFEHAAPILDGHADRRCGLVEPSLVRVGIVPAVEEGRFAQYRARLASRIGAAGLGSAPPAPPPDRWLL